LREANPEMGLAGACYLQNFACWVMIRPSYFMYPYFRAYDGHFKTYGIWKYHMENMEIHLYIWKIWKFIWKYGSFVGVAEIFFHIL
jgi:hypothetical protein